MKKIIVDIDGTCSNAAHRLHFIQNKPADWDAFHDNVHADAVHGDIRALVSLIARSTLGVEILYVTGRMERCREDTEHWLYQHAFPQGLLYMRKNKDYRQDYIIKSETADALGLTPENVWFVLDDRDQVVKMWRARGFRVLQVADGNF